MANCGIQIVRLHAPASWWFGDTTGLARRDYELGAFAWVGEVDPGGQTLWACDLIPLPANGWEGQNDMGWCNEKARHRHQERQQHPGAGRAHQVVHRTSQAAYTEDVPAIPLFNRTEVFAAAADLVGFAPHAGEEYYSYNAGTLGCPRQRYPGSLASPRNLPRSSAWWKMPSSPTWSLSCWAPTAASTTPPTTTTSRVPRGAASPPWRLAKSAQ